MLSWPFFPLDTAAVDTGQGVVVSFCTTLPLKEKVLTSDLGLLK